MTRRCRLCDGQCHKPENLPRRGTIHAGGFFELLRRRFEIADHDPDDDRNSDDEMDDDLRPERAEQVQPLEQQKQRNEKGEAGRHACNHDDDGCLFGLQSRNAVTCGNADDERRKVAAP